MPPHLPLLKAPPLIFVAVRDLTITVKGQTRPRYKALGYEGMQFKWDRDRQQWYGPLTLKNLEALERWPEAVLSQEARRAMEEFRKAARRRREYYRRRV
ncbi:MAG: hypothetical protein WBL87_02630 [Methanothrix sp.]